MYAVEVKYTAMNSLLIVRSWKEYQ